MVAGDRETGLWTHSDAQVNPCVFSSEGRCADARYANPSPAVWFNFSGQAEKMEQSPPPLLSPGLPLLHTHPRQVRRHGSALFRCIPARNSREDARRSDCYSGNIWIDSRRPKHQGVRACVRKGVFICSIVVFCLFSTNFPLTGSFSFICLVGFYLLFRHTFWCISSVVTNQNKYNN